MAKLNKNISEPSILVKPVSRMGGLDNIHLALIILVVILILLIVAISYNTKITVINSTSSANSSCVYGTSNGTCVTPMHSVAQVKLFAEKVLAGYADLNSSLSLLPFISNVSIMNVSYVPSMKDWYVSFPYVGPASSKPYTYSFLIRDSNLSLASSSVQSVNPLSFNQNYVAYPGVIKLAQQSSCSYGKPLQVYWFVDPYAPGGVSSLVTASNLQQRYGSKVNITIKALFTQYSTKISNAYGLNNTLALEKYLLCGSTQKNFSGFVSAVNASYTGTYVPGYILQGIATASGFNASQLGSCISSTQSVINAQALLAKYYNITSSSSVITDCQYLSLPQTAQNAICYANSTMC